MEEAPDNSTALGVSDVDRITVVTIKIVVPYLVNRVQSGFSRNDILSIWGEGQVFKLAKGENFSFWVVKLIFQLINFICPYPLNRAHVKEVLSHSLFQVPHFAGLPRMKP